MRSRTPNTAGAGQFCPVQLIVIPRHYEVMQSLIFITITEKQRGHSGKFPKCPLVMLTLSRVLLIPPNAREVGIGALARDGRLEAHVVHLLFVTRVRQSTRNLRHVWIRFRSHLD